MPQSAHGRALVPLTDSGGSRGGPRSRPQAPGLVDPSPSPSPPHSRSPTAAKSFGFAFGFTRRASLASTVSSARRSPPAAAGDAGAGAGAADAGDASPPTTDRVAPAEMAASTAMTAVTSPPSMPSSTMPRGLQRLRKTLHRAVSLSSLSGRFKRSPHAAAGPSARDGRAESSSPGAPPSPPSPLSSSPLPPSPPPPPPPPGLQTPSAPSTPAGALAARRPSHGEPPAAEIGASMRDSIFSRITDTSDGPAGVDAAWAPPPDGYLEARRPSGYPAALADIRAFHSMSGMSDASTVLSASRMSPALHMPRARPAAAAAQDMAMSPHSEHERESEDDDHVFHPIYTPQYSIPSSPTSERALRSPGGGFFPASLAAAGATSPAAAPAAEGPEGLHQAHSRQPHRHRQTEGDGDDDDDDDGNRASQMSGHGGMPQARPMRRVTRSRARSRSRSSSRSSRSTSAASSLSRSASRSRSRSTRRVSPRRGGGGGHAASMPHAAGARVATTTQAMRAEKRVVPRVTDTDTGTDTETDSPQPFFVARQAVRPPSPASPSASPSASPFPMPVTRRRRSSLSSRDPESNAGSADRRRAWAAAGPRRPSTASGMTGEAHASVMSTARRSMSLGAPRLAAGATPHQDASVARETMQLDAMLPLDDADPSVLRRRKTGLASASGDAVRKLRQAATTLRARSLTNMRQIFATGAADRPSSRRSPLARHVSRRDGAAPSDAPRPMDIVHLTHARSRRARMHTPPQPTSSAHVDELDVYAEYCAADEAVLRPGLVKLMGLAAAASTRLGDESPTTVAAFTTPQDDAETGPDDGLAATASSPSSISPSARVKLDPNEDGDDASPIRSAVDDDGDDDHPEAHDDRERPFASPVSDVDMTLDSESDAYPTAATHVVPFPSLPRNLNDLLATRTLDRHSRSMAEPEEVDASAASATTTPTIDVDLAALGSDGDHARRATAVSPASPLPPGPTAFAATAEPSTAALTTAPATPPGPMPTAAPASASPTVPTTPAAAATLASCRPSAAFIPGIVSATLMRSKSLSHRAPMEHTARHKLARAQLTVSPATLERVAASAAAFPEPPSPLRAAPPVPRLVASESAPAPAAVAADLQMSELDSHDLDAFDNEDGDEDSASASPLPPAAPSTERSSPEPADAAATDEERARRRQERQEKTLSISTKLHLIVQKTLPRTKTVLASVKQEALTAAGAAATTDEPCAARPDGVSEGATVPTASSRDPELDGVAAMPSMPPSMAAEASSQDAAAAPSDRSAPVEALHSGKPPMPMPVLTPTPTAASAASGHASARDVEKARELVLQLKALMDTVRANPDRTLSPLREEPADADGDGDGDAAGLASTDDEGFASSSDITGTDIDPDGDGDGDGDMDGAGRRRSGRRPHWTERVRALHAQRAAAAETAGDASDAPSPALAAAVAADPAAMSPLPLANGRLPSPAPRPEPGMDGEGAMADAAASASGGLFSPSPAAAASPASPANRVVMTDTQLAAWKRLRSRIVRLDVRRRWDPAVVFEPPAGEAAAGSATAPRADAADAVDFLALWTRTARGATLGELLAFT